MGQKVRFHLHSKSGCFADAASGEWKVTSTIPKADRGHRPITSILSSQNSSVRYMIVNLIKRIISFIRTALQELAPTR